MGRNPALSVLDSYLQPPTTQDQENTYKKSAIHGLRCILPEARGQGTRGLPQKYQKLDAKIGTHADETGPVETEMESYNPKRVSGFDVGEFGGVSMQVREFAGLVACELNAKHLAFFDGAMNENWQMFT